MSPIFAALLVGTLAAQHLDARAWDPEVGSVPGSLQNLELHDGGSLDLKHLRGDPVVVYVGAEWCVPCVTSGRPALLRVFDRFKERGLKVVYVSADDNSERVKLHAWASSIGVHLLMARLEDCPPYKCTKGVRGDLGDFGRAYVLPSVYVIDSSGFLRAKFERARDIRAGLEASVEPLLTK